MIQLRSCWVSWRPTERVITTAARKSNYEFKKYINIYIYFLKLSLRQNSMEFSRAESRVKILRFSDISGTNSVHSFTPQHSEDGMEFAPERSANLNILTRLSARENIIEYTHLLNLLLFGLII